MRRFWTFWILMTLGLGACPGLAAEPPVVKLATLAPEGSSWHLILKDMGERWKRAPGGGVRLRLYPGGVMGDEPDMIRKLRIGQLDAAMLTVVGLSKLDPPSFALSLPMVYRSEAELDHVLSKLRPSLEEGLRAKGYEVLNWGEAGWVTFFGKEPIRTPQDLRGMKFFVWAGDDAAEKLWKQAGYHPVPLAATDILPGLQTGLINAFPSTPLAALSFQWFPLAPHMTDLKWAPLVGATIVSRRAWNRIPEAAKPEIRAAAREAEERLRRDVRAANEKAVEVMRQHGLTVHTLTEEQQAAWRAAFEEAFPQIRETLVPAEVFDRTLKIRDAYRAAQGAGTP